MRSTTELRLQAYEFSAAYVERELIARGQGSPLKTCILNDGPDMQPPVSDWSLADEICCIGDVPAFLNANCEFVFERLLENKKDNSKPCSHRVLNIVYSKVFIFM